MISYKLLVVGFFGDEVRLKKDVHRWQVSAGNFF